MSQEKGAVLQCCDLTQTLTTWETILSDPSMQAAADYCCRNLFINQLGFYSKKYIKI